MKKDSTLVYPEDYMRQQPLSSAKETFIGFKSPGHPGMVFINVNQIQLIYEQGDQVYVVSNGNVYQINQSLANFIESADCIEFVYIASDKD